MKMLGLAALLLGQSFLVPGTRSAAVVGQVVDLAGTPAENIRVVALEGLAADEGPDLVVSITQTDHEGRFVLEGIPPGRYIFAVGSLANPTYFPGVPSNGQATALYLKAGVTVPGIDFRVPYGPVSGRLLYQEDGSPVSNVRIGLTPKSPDAGAMLSGKTDKDGRFSIRNVPLGAYQLFAGPKGREAFLPSNSEALTIVIDLQTLPPPLELRVARSHPGIMASQPPTQTKSQPMTATDDVEAMLLQLIEEKRRPK